MKKSPLIPSYKGPRVESLEDLCKIIKAEHVDLQELVYKSKDLYQQIVRKKDDGSLRFCYDALDPLKNIQLQIKTEILDHVIYPPYLQGGIKDVGNPRSYVQNAKLHIGSRVLFKADVANFFPSITQAHVYEIFSGFLGFPTVPSRLLTLLCTRCGSVPQGTHTAQHLANLLFWNYEHELVLKLDSMSWKYSRLTDDVTISSTSKKAAVESTRAVALIYGMFKAYGLHPKRSKEKYVSSARRMVMHNLTVNTKPSLAPEKQKLITRDVHRMIIRLNSAEELSIEEDRELRSVSCRLGVMRKFHPAVGGRLRLALRSARLAHSARVLV